jgi:hypothetical protein
MLFPNGHGLYDLGSDEFSYDINDGRDTIFVIFRKDFRESTARKDYAGVEQSELVASVTFRFGPAHFEVEMGCCFLQNIYK